MNGINPIQTIGGVDGGVPSLKRPLNSGHLDGGDLIPAKKAPEAGELNTMSDAENVTDIYPVPEKVVGLVIGKGGSEIRNIQAASGCRVQMDPDHQSVNGFRNCTIEGPPQQVALARQLIGNIINRQQNAGGPGGPGPQTGEITEDMLIPADKCGLVIGKGGETIRTVQEQAGLRAINVVQDSTASTGQPKPLRMIGLPQAIETAKMLVANIMNSQQSGGGHGGHGGAGQMMRTGGYGGGGNEAMAKGEVIVPRVSAGMIIGRGGEMIKRLAMETGTKIQFKPDENPNSEDRVAVIMGTRDQIYRATERITDIVNRAVKNAGGTPNLGTGGSGGRGGGEVFYMHVPANKCGLVIGKGGENIKQIERETGASCGLAPASEQKKEDEKVFEIKGSSSQIHHASHLIKIKVGEIAPNTPVPAMQGGYGGGGYGGHMQTAQVAQVYGQPQQQQQQQYGMSQQWGSNGGAVAHHQMAAADVYSGAAVQQQTQVAAVVPQAAAQPESSAPAVNPTTGAPDYSAQWAAYYRSIGLVDQAAMVENQMRRNQTSDASGAAVQPTQAYYPHPQ